MQREDAGQREHDLREVFNGVRYIVKMEVWGVRKTLVGLPETADQAANPILDA